MTAPTPRGRMSSKRRQHIFSENSTAHNLAPCCICGRLIHRHNDVWIVEHKRALGLLGSDSNPNCAPAHETCRREKDKEDLARIAKAKRQEAAGVAAKDNLSQEQVIRARRGLNVPAGVVYDWKQRRYVATSSEVTQ